VVNTLNPVLLKPFVLLAKNIQPMTVPTVVFSVFVVFEELYEPLNAVHVSFAHGPVLLVENM
jgi:hypothetical protein